VMQCDAHTRLYGMVSSLSLSTEALAGASWLGDEGMTNDDDGSRA